MSEANYFSPRSKKNMKIYKVIEIPLKEYRQQLNFQSYNYSDGARVKLAELYNLVEQNLKSAQEYADKEFNREEKDMIPCDLWDILFEVAMGEEYLTKL
jgi:hypothetical protein